MPKTREELIRMYEEEMEANLRLYQSGEDDYAYNRYKTLAEYVRELRTQ
jgi:hypothetical protein